MRIGSALPGILLVAVCLLAAGSAAMAQNAGNSTAVTGTVADPSGAVIPGATVTIHNPVSQYERSTTTDATGNFSPRPRASAMSRTGTPSSATA